MSESSLTNSALKKGGPNRFVPPQQLLDLLGKQSDMNLCYRFNCSYSTIRKLRLERGVPAYRPAEATNGVVTDSDQGTEWWTMVAAAMAWGVSYPRACELLADIPDLVRVDGRRILIPKGTPKPTRGGVAPGQIPLETAGDPT